MSVIDIEKFEKSVGKVMFDKFVENLGEIKSCIEYEKFYYLGAFGENRNVAQVYKDGSTFDSVLEIYKRLLSSPVVTIKLENPNSKGKFEKINIYVFDYLTKINYFIRELNTVIFEPYLQGDFMNAYINEGSVIIYWKYLVLREAFKNIGVNIPKISIFSDGLSLRGFDIVFSNFFDLSISEKIVFSSPSITFKSKISDNDFQKYFSKNRNPTMAIEYLGSKYIENVSNFHEINYSLNIDYYLKFLDNTFNIQNFSMNNLNVNYLSTIINDDYTSYENMKAASSLINSAIKSIYIDNHPSKEIQNWLIDINNIAEGVQGSVYFANLFDTTIPISFKLSKSLEIKNCYLPTYADFIAEFFKSFGAINKLRKIVPTFMYTYGMFDCDVELDPNGSQRDGKLIDLNKSTLCLDKSPRQPFVLIERIQGKTIEKMINEGSIDIKMFLCIFQQILLSLEIAQKEISFAHYDLHGKNIILKPVPDGYTYSVLINNKKITITDPKFIPVFIDFGLSSCIVMDKLYGRFNYEPHEIYNFLVPCTDYIKILISCLWYAVKNSDVNLLQVIEKIFSSDIMKNNISDTQEKINEILHQDVLLSVFNRNGKCASKTPLELFISIQEKIGFAEISMVDREEFSINSFKNSEHILIDLYDSDDSNHSNSLEFLEEIIKENYISESLINTMYSLKNLKEYYKTMRYPKLLKHIEIVSEAINEGRNEMIKVDERHFNNMREMKLPDENQFLIESEYLESLNFIDLDPINYSKIKKMKSMCDHFDFFTNLMDRFYKARELNILDGLLDTFINCENYKYYERNVLRYSKMNRWCNTLLNSIEFI